MEAIYGPALEQSWPEREEFVRLRICWELRAMLDTVRQLKQHPTDKIIGEYITTLR